MTEDLISIIVGQTKIIFSNIEETLKSTEESQLYDRKICDWPLGEQLIHLLHSFDRWFINPDDYEEPEIRKNGNARYRVLKKSEIHEYYQTIKTKISGYLEDLKADSLIEKPAECQFTKLALILGQYRHVMYHIGLIHGCLRTYSGGQNPTYFGLSPSLKPPVKG